MSEHWKIHDPRNPETANPQTTIPPPDPPDQPAVPVTIPDFPPIELTDCASYDDG
jgi:hypothetical protein